MALADFNRQVLYLRLIVNFLNVSLGFLDLIFTFSISALSFAVSICMPCISVKN